MEELRASPRGALEGPFYSRPNLYRTRSGSPERRAGAVTPALDSVRDVRYVSRSRTWCRGWSSCCRATVYDRV